MKRFTRGFTMIELLIVIAVLGILAIAVLSAINPIEQINRGRDTSSRSDAEQLLSAIDRYNASVGLWPWQNAAGEESAVDWKAISADYPPTAVGCKMLQNLAADPGGACPGTDEIKAAFVQRVIDTTKNPLFIEYQAGAGNSVYVCFSPQSGSFSQEAAARCDETTGFTPDDYPTAACGGCADLPGSLGESEDCICLP